MRRRALPRADPEPHEHPDSGPEELLRIGILGDRLPDYAKHENLETAICRAAAASGLRVEASWVPTERLARRVAAVLRGYDGLVAAPQSPEYCEHPAALQAALRFARRSGLCCLAVCGGAQSALREHASELMGVAGSDAVLSAASCDPAIRSNDYAISGLQSVELTEGSGLAARFGGPVALEHFACSFTFDEDAGVALLENGVSVAGTSPRIGATLFEWSCLPFYVAALFLPHWRSEKPHPLFTGLLDCALGRRRESAAASLP